MVSEENMSEHNNNRHGELAEQTQMEGNVAEPAQISGGVGSTDSVLLADGAWSSSGAATIPQVLSNYANNNNFFGAKKEQQQNGPLFSSSSSSGNGISTALPMDDDDSWKQDADLSNGDSKSEEQRRGHQEEKASSSMNFRERKENEENSPERKGNSSRRGSSHNHHHHHHHEVNNSGKENNNGEEEEEEKNIKADKKIEDENDDDNNEEDNGDEEKEEGGTKRGHSSLALGQDIGGVFVQAAAAVLQASAVKEEVAISPRSATKNPVRRLIRRIVWNSWFDRFIIAAILVNCFFLARQDEGEVESRIGDALELPFAILFTTEAALKIVAYGVLGYFSDNWNKFDFLMVLIAWLNFVPGVDNYTAFRAFRVLRTLRSLQAAKEMRKLVSIILSVIPGLVNVLMLWASLFAIFGIIGLQLFSGSMKYRCANVSYVNSTQIVTWNPDDRCCDINGAGYTCADDETCLYSGQNPDWNITSFDNLLYAMLTVFQVLTTEGWSDIMYSLQDAFSPSLSVVYFVLLVVLGGFFAVNLALAVVADRFVTVTSQMKLMHARQSESSFAWLNRFRFFRYIMSLRAEVARQHETIHNISEEDFQKLPRVRARILHIVQHPMFDSLAISLVVGNCIILALDHDGIDDLVSDRLAKANVSFVAAFSLEAILKITAYRWGYFHDPFNRFDFVVILAGWLEFSIGSRASLSVLRVFRLARAFKLVKSFRSIRRILMTVWGSMTSFAYLSFLMAIFVGIAALLGKAFFGGNFDFDDGKPRAHFDSFGNAALAVFQILTSENWNEIWWNGVRAGGLVASIYFIIAVLIGQYLVVNLFLAVLLSYVDVEAEVFSSLADLTSRFRGNSVATILQQRAASLLRGIATLGQRNVVVHAHPMEGEEGDAAQTNGGSIDPATATKGTIVADMSSINSVKLSSSFGRRSNRIVPVVESNGATASHHQHHHHHTGEGYNNVEICYGLDSKYHKHPHSSNVTTVVPSMLNNDDGSKNNNDSQHQTPLKEEATFAGTGIVVRRPQPLPPAALQQDGEKLALPSPNETSSSPSTKKNGVLLINTESASPSGAGAVQLVPRADSGVASLVNSNGSSIFAAGSPLESVSVASRSALVDLPAVASTSSSSSSSARKAPTLHPLPPLIVKPQGGVSSVPNSARLAPADGESLFLPGAVVSVVGTPREPIDDDDDANMQVSVRAPPSLSNKNNSTGAATPGSTSSGAPSAADVVLPSVPPRLSPPSFDSASGGGVGGGDYFDSGTNTPSSKVGFNLPADVSSGGVSEANLKKLVASKGLLGLQERQRIRQEIAQQQKMQRQLKASPRRGKNNNKSRRGSRTSSSPVNKDGYGDRNLTSEILESGGLPSARGGGRSRHDSLDGHSTDRKHRHFDDEDGSHFDESDVDSYNEYDDHYDDDEEDEHKAEERRRRRQQRRKEEEEEAAVATIQTPAEEIKLVGVSLFVFSETNKFRVALAKIAKKPWFDNGVLLCIVASSISLVFQNDDTETLEGKILSDLDYFFTAVFVAEAIMKIIILGAVSVPSAYLRSGWNILDFFIVVVSLIDSLTPGSSLSALRSLRTLRALRPLRMLHRFPGLKIVVNSLLECIPVFVNIGSVLLVFFFVFGITAVSFFSGSFKYCTLDGYVGTRDGCIAAGGDWLSYRQNFDDVLIAMLTLFEVATTEMWLVVMYQAIDSRGPDLTPERDYQPEAALFFVIFIIMGAFIVMNLFVSAVVDNFNKLTSKERAGGVLLTESQQLFIGAVRNWLQRKPSVQYHRPKNAVRGVFYDAAISSIFESIIMGVIIINTITMAMQHDGQSSVWDNVLDYFNLAFAIIFFLEMVIKLIAFDKDYFRTGWNLFDFIIVWLTIVDIGMKYNSGQSLPIPPTIVRSFRIVRIVRIVRLMRRSGGLLRLLEALLESIPALFNIGCVLLLLYFIAAIVGTQFFGNVMHQDYITDHANFENFGNSLLTLFRMSTGENWDGIMHDCMVQEPVCSNDIGNCGSRFAWIYFALITIFIHYLVMNMVIAVLLERLQESVKMENDKLVSEVFELASSWSAYDPDGKFSAPTEHLLAWLRTVPPPLGIGTECSRVMQLHFLLQLDIPDRGGLVFFVEAVRALVRHRLKSEEEGDMDAFHARFTDLVERLLPKLPKMPPADYTCAQRFASLRIQAAVRARQLATLWMKEAERAEAKRASAVAARFMKKANSSSSPLLERIGTLSNVIQQSKLNDSNNGGESSGNLADPKAANGTRVVISESMLKMEKILQATQHVYSTEELAKADAAVSGERPLGQLIKDVEAQLEIFKGADAIAFLHRNIKAVRPAGHRRLIRWLSTAMTQTYMIGYD